MAKIAKGTKPSFIGKMTRKIDSNGVEYFECALWAVNEESEKEVIKE